VRTGLCDCHARKRQQPSHQEGNADAMHIGANAATGPNLR
jgi:hypothetical protein